MKILLIGCEYSGTTTLAQNIFEWGQNNMGADFGLFHDHWKIPHVTGHWPIDTEAFATGKEQNELLDLNPKMKEQMQRVRNKPQSVAKTGSSGTVETSEEDQVFDAILGIDSELESAFG